MRTRWPAPTPAPTTKSGRRSSRTSRNSERSRASSTRHKAAMAGAEKRSKRQAPPSVGDLYEQAYALQSLVLAKAEAIGGDAGVVYGNTKTVARAFQKAWRSYAGDYRRLCDVVRVSIAFETIDELTACLERIVADDELELVPQGLEKCRFDPEYAPNGPGQFVGYRDLQLGVARFRSEATRKQGLDQHVVEIQLHLRVFEAIKRGHVTVGLPVHTNLADWRMGGGPTTVATAAPPLGLSPLPRFSDFRTPSPEVHPPEERPEQTTPAPSAIVPTLPIFPKTLPTAFAASDGPGRVRSRAAHAFAAPPTSKLPTASRGRGRVRRRAAHHARGARRHRATRPTKRRRRSSGRRPSRSRRRPPGRRRRPRSPRDPSSVRPRVVPAEGRRVYEARGPDAQIRQFQVGRGKNSNRRRDAGGGRHHQSRRGGRFRGLYFNTTGGRLLGLDSVLRRRRRVDEDD